MKWVRKMILKLEEYSQTQYFSPLWIHSDMSCSIVKCRTSCIEQLRKIESRSLELAWIFGLTRYVSIDSLFWVRRDSRASSGWFAPNSLLVPPIVVILTFIIEVDVEGIDGNEKWSGWPWRKSRWHWKNSGSTRYLTPITRSHFEDGVVAWHKNHHLRLSLHCAPRISQVHLEVHLVDFAQLQLHGKIARHVSRALAHSQLQT